MILNLNHFENDVAVITEEGKTIIYRELSFYCEKLIQNIKKRCLIFNLCSNTLGSLVGYVAFLNNDIVTLMLSDKLDLSLLEYYIKTYKPDYLYVPDSVIEKFNLLEIIYSDIGYNLLKTEYSCEYILHNDLALLLTTSGVTGSPKLVRQSYTNITSNTESIVKFLNINKQERAITTLPMNYTYGISVINSHLSVGASIVISTKGLMQKYFWQQFNEYHVTSFSGVPYTYEMLDKLRFFRMDFPSLKTLTQAGGKLSLELHRKFAKYAVENNKKFIVMYGQTEATARISYLPAEKSLEKCGSIGIAIPQGNLYLVDNYGNKILDPGIVGELVYSGKNVMLGYADSSKDLSLGDGQYGKLFTGDMAKFDHEGFFYIVGRKKRFLKIFGNRINLDEIELLIKKEFAFLECACIGKDDNMLICITDDEFSRNVLNFLSKKTGINSAAFKVKVIEKIPKNEAGKTLYKILEDIFCVYDNG